MNSLVLKFHSKLKRINLYQLDMKTWDESKVSPFEGSINKEKA